MEKVLELRPRVFLPLTIDNRSKERVRGRTVCRERREEERRGKESASFEEHGLRGCRIPRAGPRFRPFLRRYFIIRNSGHPSHFHRNGS